MSNVRGHKKAASLAGLAAGAELTTGGGNVLTSEYHKRQAFVIGTPSRVVPHSQDAGLTNSLLPPSKASGADPVVHPDRCGVGGPARGVGGQGVKVIGMGLRRRGQCDGSPLVQRRGNGDAAGLGTCTKLPTPPLPAPPIESKRRRYVLLDAAARLLPDARVADCSRFTQSGGDAVTVHGGEGRGWYSGLAVCGDVWTCPVCSVRILTRRRGELEAGLTAARKRGWSVLLLTVTVRHHAGEGLPDVLRALREAWTKTRSGAPWSRFAAAHGVVGSVTALEVTHGGEGWHPHRHILLFLDHVVSKAEREDMRAWLSERFGTMAARCGRYASPDYGVDLRANGAAVSYVSKLDAELTASESKAGSGSTPFALLAKAATGDAVAARLFTHYAGAMRGAQRLRWSRGLRELLGVDVLEDAEAASEDPDQDQGAAGPLAVLSRDQWARVVRAGKRGELLTVAAFGSRQVVWQYLSILGVQRGSWNDDREAAADQVGEVGNECA